MPKRQRVSRYSIVAAEDNLPENSGVQGTDNYGVDAITRDNASRRRSSPGRRPSSSATSLTLPPSPSPNSRPRGGQRGQQQYKGGHSPSASSRRRPSPKRQQQQRQMAATEILLQLLKACEKHRSTCHPDYHPRNGGQHSEIPPACESAIKSLKMLIPKLENTISPTHDTCNKKIRSNDIAQLCRFYDNVVRGTYCPHLPHLFGFGTDPQIILDKVLYLIRNSVNVDLDWNSDGTKDEERNRKKTFTPAMEFLDVVSHTIAGLIASVIDDSNDHIRRKLFVDWIDFSEDVAVLSTMKHQTNLEWKGATFLPVQVILFEESSLVIHQRSLGEKQQSEGNDEEQILDDDIKIQNFSIDICRWEQIRILQEICIRVLGSLTSKECALERLEVSPDQQGEEPSLMLGGDMDTFFPPGIVTDMDLVSSLLASLKPFMLRPYGEKDLLDNEHFGVSTTPIEILFRLCLDWHRLGSATIAIPMLPCMIDAAILTTKTVFNVLSGQQQLQRNDDEESIRHNNEKILAVLLNRMVCHSPGCTANETDSVESILKTIHSAVWTLLLDCLAGIAARLHLRRDRKIQGYKEGQVPVVNGSNAITRSPTSRASSIALDLAVLDAIHFIASTTPSLALDGSNYCTARGIFPNLFFLCSATSLAMCHHKHDWNNDCSLTKTANQCVALFMHASLARDSISYHQLDNTFREMLRGREIRVEKHDGEEKGAYGMDYAVVQKGGPPEATTLQPRRSDRSDCMDDDGDDMGREPHGFKRKRQLSMLQESDVSPSVKRRKPLSSNEISSATIHPITWYSGLESYLRMVVDAGDNLRKWLKLGVLQNSESNEIEVAHMIEQIRRLSGGFHLVMALSRKLSRIPCAENENKPLPGISRLAHTLSTQIVSCCELFLKTIKTKEELERPLSFVAADAILECGLVVYFSKSECENGWDESLAQFVGKFLDSVSSFSGSLLELGPSRRFDFVCFSKRTGLPAYFSGAGNRDIFESWCFSHFMINKSRQQLGEWLFDRSITTLNSFPLFVRAALVSSLHPVEFNLFSPESDQGESNSRSGHFSFDMFSTFFTRYAEDKSRESTDLDSSIRVASLLHLLPTMMISLRKKRSESYQAMELHNEKDDFEGEMKEESWNFYLQVLLRKGLTPLIGALRSQDTMIFQSLVFALCRINLLITGKELGIAVQDPTGVLELLAIRHLRLHPTESKKDELRRMMINIANKGIGNDENPLSRYFLWMCGATYCSSASASEILHCSRNTATAPSRTYSDKRKAPRNGLLPWLVATPFSDPSALLRKFIARELSTLLMSKEYGFLVSHFASSGHYKDYYSYSRSERANLSDGPMCTLIQMSDHVVNGLFEEIDVILNGCVLSESQLSLPDTKDEGSPSEPSGHSKYNNRISMQHTAAKTLASLCHDADLNHPIGKTLFEMGALRLIRMWAARSNNSGDTFYFPALQSTPVGRALAFGGLFCLSGSRNLGQCFSGGKTWTYFPSASFRDVLVLNNGIDRRGQYELLERMVRSFFIFSHDSLHQKQSSREASKVVTQSIPLTIAQLVNEKNEKAIRLIIGFNHYLTERLDVNDDAIHPEVQMIGIIKPEIEQNQYQALSMGVRQLQKETKKVCLKHIEKILPLILSHSDKAEALPLKTFTKLTTPVTLADMMAARELPILKGIAWELGRDAHRVKPALTALKIATNACYKESLDGQNAATSWVTKNFMYLIVNVVQINWGSLQTTHKVQALRSLHLLLDFLNPSDASPYLPQILSTVNVAITRNGVDGIHDFEDSSLRLHAVRCLSKFIRLSAKDNIEAVVDNLTTIVVSLLPILGEDGADEEESQYQEARAEAASMLEFLASADFVRRFPKAFSRIPFLPTTPSLARVHTSLRDNGINFDNLVILSTTNSESQAGTLSRRETLTNENISNTASSTSSYNGDYVLALQNRISLVASLLADENASVRNVALQHLVDLLRANRNSFHILVENEGGSSAKNFLTLVYDQVQSGANKSNRGHPTKATNVSVSNIIEILMQRCVEETDERVCLQLATCLGEIGAIGEHRLDDMTLFRSRGKGSKSMYEWRLDQPPWQSRAAKYELQLVTKYLVAALKSAPSQEEQLKIAYTIQQLLLLLDASVREDSNIEIENHLSISKKREMSKWLLDRLVEADVYESVEPFWLSEFSTKKDERYNRQPPFFNESKTYLLWISEFCRWMIWKTKDCPLSRWKDFFFACRIVVRSGSAGLEAAEFILPLLVLDRICFGSVEEFESICREFLLILDFNSEQVLMDSGERQKAVGGFFSMIDTLEYWAEIEAEQRYRSKTTSRRSTKGNIRHNSMIGGKDNSLSNWPADDTITQIEELISRLPLIDQARAATKVGMHAKGLRLLELVARKGVVKDFFESSSDDKAGEISTNGNIFQHALMKNVNIDMMKIALSNLNDCETLNVIGESAYLISPLLNVNDSIQWKEASGDYEGALRDYERAIQARNVNHPITGSCMEKGAISCLLKLGRFESALRHAVTDDETTDKTSTKAYAIEAACHLGQWDKLSDLITENEGSEINFSPDDAYRQATGKAILCLRNKRWEEVGESLRTARNAVMDSLSRVARESYSRSYSDIAKLQSIRELEDATALFHTWDGGDECSLSEIVESTYQKGWAWKGRLKLTTPRAATTIMHTRVAIARLADDRVMESSLLLDIGKQASDNGMCTVAEDFYSKAEAVLSKIPDCQNDKDQKLDSLLDDIRIQYANLKKESGENLVALKIIGQQMVHDALVEMNLGNEDMGVLKNIAVKYEQSRVENALGKKFPLGDDQRLIDRFANRLLRLTQWTVESGMQSGNEIMERFQTVIKLSPKWERGHFQFAKYLNDSVTRFFEKGSPHGMEEDLVRFHSLYRDRVCHEYILLAIEHYATTLKLDVKHIYHALPRLLSLWFDFVSVEIPSTDDQMPSGSRNPEYLKFLAENQNKANILMADNIKSIPAAAYYTAMPQLISRVIHNNEDTGKIVKRILERALTKFPPQAMWHLAWLKGSKNDERSKIGADIFKGAQRVLIKNRQPQVANLLKASDSLFKFLKDLARYTPKEKHSSILPVRSWKGIADLSEFIPPVQAALSISPFKPVKSSSKEYFPRVIPRMRAFSSKVNIMHSKARPKRIKAFAVPGTWKHANVTEHSNADGRISSSTPLDCDIGEIHFLVKQEAKGDLRKDARVQDLNNVINRLMASSNNSNSTLSSKSRRLRVRTFAVTCLSEDTGILEWVPDTDSLRSLVSKSYNPQVSSFCDRRRGTRMTNFNDSTLRSGFERAQNQFVKNGDLAQAVKLYHLLVLRQYPPVLSWWFIQHFRSATDWYEARQKFALTAAAWSAIGHVIGLGDRHSENILVETKTGRIVHVDFDCIFDKGLNLPRPEVVPFRLTPNLLDAFGPTGADGMFKSGMESSLEILRENRETLLSVLEPFIKDPVIDWKRQRTQQSVSQAIGKANGSEAKRSIKVIKERLSGICNLRNPNYRKLRNIIPKDIRHRVEQDNMMKEILPLSVEGQVQKLCTEASKNENLVQVYVGWMPWI